MTTVIESIRNLTLSEDERALRKAGLKDSCGHWTDAARQAFLEDQMTKSPESLITMAKAINAENDSK